MLKITGIEEAKKKLTDLANKAKALDGQHSVSLTDLLTPDFLSQHTRFANAEEMFKASGFKVESQEDFAAIPDNEWDAFIRSASSFADWKEMLGAATKEWTRKQLGF